MLTLLSLVACNRVDSQPLEAALMVDPERSSDLVVVLDASTSFLEEMDAAVAGIGAILATLGEDITAADSVALVTFTGGAVVHTPATDLGGSMTDLERAWTGDGRSNLDPEKKRGLTNCYPTTCHLADGCAADETTLQGEWMMPCGTEGSDGVYGYSNPADGVKAGLGELAATTYEGVPQHLLLITDGRPTCEGADSEDNDCADARRERLIRQADAAGEANVNLYVLGLNTNESLEQEELLAGLVRGSGDFWAVSTPEDAADAMAAMAEELK